MNLPDDSIGISDILAHRECPRRMSYGMKRHTGRGQQDDRMAPEGRSYATSYGSAVHDVIQAVEDGYTDEDAIQKAWSKWGAELEPTDIDRMRDDLAIYRSRDFPATRTIASEDEFRVPLFEHEGRTIYFRFKVDRLYERIDAPGTFIHIDYKSSKHPKSEAEIVSDKQLWSYSFGLHEVFPEIERLLQFYDQLNYGQVPIPPKTPDQRRQMKEWLILEVRSILDDEDYRDDGLLAPTHNQWCAWCPLLESCPVIHELSDYALTRIAALAPTRKEGRKTVLALDPDRLNDYAEELGPVNDALRVLERYAETVKGLLRELPEEQRAEAGYKLRPRTNNVFGSRAAEALHETLGERFYDLVKITKTGLESQLGSDPDLLAWALALAEERDGQPAVVPMS